MVQTAVGQRHTQVVDDAVTLLIRHPEIKDVVGASHASILPHVTNPTTQPLEVRGGWVRNNTERAAAGTRSRIHSGWVPRNELGASRAHAPKQCEGAGCPERAEAIVLTCLK